MKKLVRSLYSALCLLLALSISQSLAAKTIVVKFVGGLQKAVNEAQAGDTVLVTNGMYTTGTDIIVKGVGTKEKPIIIMAQTAGQVEMTGLGGFSLVKPAAYVVITGFKFTHSAERARCAPGTSFCRFTRNIFENEGEGDDLTIAGSDHQIDYNTFNHKKVMGRFLAIRGEGKQVAERLHIHHNYFYNFDIPGGASGVEPLLFGQGNYSASKSSSIVEHNLFEECHGEGELFAIKASGVTLRYNTIRNCKSQLVLRNGHASAVYGNYFHNTKGLLLYGHDHLVHSNYFEVCSKGIELGNGVTEDDQPNRALIAFNTIISAKAPISMAARDKGLGAANITLAHNIIRGGGPASAIAGPFTTPVWEGNVVFNAESKGDIPDGGFSTTDPKLGRGDNATIHLLKGSPAIDVVQAPKGKNILNKYSSVTTDMDGQPRTLPFDAGADEVSAAPVVARILNPADVGVDAK